MGRQEHNFFQQSHDCFPACSRHPSFFDEWMHGMSQTVTLQNFHCRTSLSFTEDKTLIRVNSFFLGGGSNIMFYPLFGEDETILRIILDIFSNSLKPVFLVLFMSYFDVKLRGPEVHFS